MMPQWDARKEAGNVKHHGVVFEEALTVFLANILDDPDERQSFRGGI